MKRCTRMSMIFIMTGWFLINPHISAAQKAEVIDFATLEQLIGNQQKGISVINFWATWCKPCIKELPYIDQLAANVDFDVRVILVSLDDVESTESKVNKFIQAKDVVSKVVVLNDIDYNSWIDKVSPAWTGAIPATLLINHETGERLFFERELQQGEIELLVQQLYIKK